MLKGVSLSAIAYAKEILEPLKSKEVTAKINSLFLYLRPGVNADLTKLDNLEKFLKGCITREVIGRIKNRNGIEESEQEYRTRIGQAQYNIAKITDDIRLGLDRRGEVHFYVKFGKDKKEEYEVGTADTLTLVRSVFEQFILNGDNQEKMPLEYVLEKGMIEKIEEEEKMGEQVLGLKKTLKELELKNSKLQHDFLESQQNAEIANETREMMEIELKINQEQLKEVTRLVVRHENLKEQNERLRGELEKEKRKSQTRRDKEKAPLGKGEIYEQMKEEIDMLVIEAAKNGDLETIEAVVGEHGGECLFAKDKNGYSALQWAEEKEHYEIVDRISRMRKIARNNRQPMEKREEKKEEIVRNDLEDQKELSQDKIKKQVPKDLVLSKESIYTAIKEGLLHIILHLIEEGVDVNSRNKSNKTPLHKIASRGNTEICKALLAKGADVNATDNHNRTPLHRAAFKGHIETCKALLQKRADVHARDESDQTPLHWASCYGNTEICKALIEKGADINARTKSKKTPLYWAAIGGHTETCKLLLEEGADANARGKSNKTSLHWAAFKGHTSTCKVLLEKGADVNAKDKDNRTALHEAAFCGHRETCKVLLERETEINVKDKTGETPLHLAVIGGFLETCELLIKKGANVNAKGEAGKTALHRAAFYGQTDICAFLLGLRVDIHAKDESNKTALHWAAFNGNTETCKLLLKKGADVSVKDEAGKTASQWARLYGYEETGMFLEKYEGKREN